MTTATNSPTNWSKPGWYLFDNLLPGNYYCDNLKCSRWIITTLPSNTTSEGLDSDLTGTKW
jgi:hypothetical protein